MRIIRVDIWVSQRERQEIRAMSVPARVHCALEIDKHKKRHRTTYNADTYNRVISNMYYHGILKCLHSEGHWLLRQSWFSTPNRTVWRSTSRSCRANVLHFTLFTSDTCNSHVPHERQHMLQERMIFLHFCFWFCFCKTCDVFLFWYIVVGASAVAFRARSLAACLYFGTSPPQRHRVARSCCCCWIWQGAVDNVAIVPGVYFWLCW